MVKGQKNKDRNIGEATTAKDELNPPSPRQYNIHLRTAEDVRRLLSTTINQVRKGEINVPAARTIIYGAQVLLTVFEQCDISDRLTKLEEAVNRYLDADKR